MNGRRMLISVAIVALLLAVTVAGIQGQGSPPEVDTPAGNGPEAQMNDVIPIQGRLTDDSGNPLNGSYSVRFRIYDEPTAGTVLCEDADLVLVSNGLFNAEMDSCTGEDIDGRQLWLGIKVGGDSEMTPRQGIYAVPYAWSLRPGAIISDTIGDAIVQIENWDPGGQGLRAYAKATSGENYGVVGASDSYDGYGGYFYNTASGYGVYGEGLVGVFGTSSIGYGVYGDGSNAGVYGTSDGSIGVYGTSSSSYGVGGTTNDASHNYGFYTPDNLYSLNFHSLGAQMQVVQNGGQEALEPGDVVVFNGLAAGNPPVIRVAQARVANSTAVAGVVYSRYNIAAVTENPEQSARGDLEVTPAGPVPPGEYLLMVIQGPAEVKASALAGAIQPGDLLSSAGPAGQAAKAAQVSIEGVETAVPGTVLGKALEPLDQGDKLIYVFVTLQ
jgi:hypothetical protein